MSDQRLKLAVFIDFDNVEIGVKTTLGLQFDVGAVLEAIKERGEIITKVAYGDWKRAGDHGRAMSQHAVRLVQRVMTPGGDKNGADINLALDALEMAFTHDHINAFVIVGGDSDFITLVEKLKQYDKKVFVVGGRAFTSQVMQKNCTEFIAYENVSGHGGGAAQVGRQGGGRPERRRSGGALSLDQALPLVKRALTVLTDREVSPQLGLLKSTLLQLDSSFSERDYGASTFRDFAEKLEQRGLVTLKHSGRTTLVELNEAGSKNNTTSVVEAAQVALSQPEQRPIEGVNDNKPAATTSTEPSLADGVALVRAVLSDATPPPRWPMYLRQMKQFIRAARPDFDERRYGSLPDLLRACQKDGLLRLERDRQGGLRTFAGGYKPSSVPQGWATVGSPLHADVELDVAVATRASAPRPDVELGDMVEATHASPMPEPPFSSADETLSEPDDQVAMFGLVSPSAEDPLPKAKRSRRTRGHPSAAAAPGTPRPLGASSRSRARTKNEGRRPKNEEPGRKEPRMRTRRSPKI